MEIGSDVTLKGQIWAETLDKLVGSVFETQWDLYALSISIGMMYDEQISSKDLPASEDEADRQVGRLVLRKPQNKALLEFMFQSALVATKHLDLDEETRLQLAFSTDETPDFNPIAFLTEFANFGVTKIHEVVKDTDDVETLEALMTFLNSTYKAGVNVLEFEDEIVDDE